ncbi:MAG: SEL1-like repeat protein [Alphaproteobacteria bacterium]|nr:SEL1-like repeat protein [Alphaproteobacteria bacterium]
MSRYIFLGIVLVFGNISEGFAFGLTVDQMYRNLVGSEQNGSRSALNEPLLTFKKADSKPEAIWQEKKAYFEKHTQKPAAFETGRQWQDIVLAVKKGDVSPFDLAEIRRLSEHENPEAIELLAWMYATGTGLRQDLQKSYTYYLQAAHMGVSSAYDNVRAVYLAMSPAQRASLPAF